MLLAFCCVQISVAQVPYCIYDNATRVLTIGYAAKLPEGAYDISTPKKDGIVLGDSILYSIFIDGAKSIVIDKSFAKFKPTTCTDWFSGFENVTTITGLENINTKNVTSMENMFLRCERLTSLDLSSFDTRNVQNMDAMFSCCYNLETILVGDKWNIAKVTSDDDGLEEYGLTSSTFSGDNKLRGGKGTLYDYEKQNYNYAVIDGGEKNPGLLTKKGAPALIGIQPYGVFNNGTLTLYYDDKHNANSIALLQWSKVAKDVKKVVFDKSFANYKPKTTSCWFENFVALSEIAGIENLNTEEVFDMTKMFRNCMSLTTLDLSRFDTKNVYRLEAMFANCINLTTIFVEDKWTLKKAIEKNIHQMEIENLDGELEIQTITENPICNIFNNCFKLCGGKGSTIVYKDEYDYASFGYEYAKIDGGASEPGLFTRKGDKPVVLNYIYANVPYVVFDNGVLTFFYGNELPQNACANYVAVISDLNWTGNLFSENVTKVVFDKSFKNYYPKSCSNWFDGFRNLTEIVDIQYLNTDHVESMYAMFCYCQSLKSLDLSNFNTEGVEIMHSMFAGCYSLKEIFVGDKWTTKSVISSTQMFYGCTQLLGGKGTKYDVVKPFDIRFYPDHPKPTHDFARIDGGENAPGLLTKK